MQKPLTWQERKFKVGRNDQLTVDGAETPVQGADQHLQRSRAHGEQVLEQKELGRECEVGQGADDKCQAGKREANDGQILEMPAVGFIAGECMHD